MLGVKMVCANLEGANLKGANFEVMNFHCVYLCILHTALFEEILFHITPRVIMIPQDPAGSRANLEGVNLKGAVLEGSIMAGINLRVATLKNVNMQNCDLRMAVLVGAPLDHSLDYHQSLTLFFGLPSSFRLEPIWRIATCLGATYMRPT